MSQIYTNKSKEEIETILSRKGVKVILVEDEDEDDYQMNQYLFTKVDEVTVVFNKDVLDSILVPYEYEDGEYTVCFSKSIYKNIDRLLDDNHIFYENGLYYTWYGSYEKTEFTISKGEELDGYYNEEPIRIKSTCKSSRK